MTIIVDVVTIVVVNYVRNSCCGSCFFDIPIFMMPMALLLQLSMSLLLL